ncbi:unnamed protein product [Angiostrongylus costaricensis]|uniref:Endo/exonuclease/phosphatase domain-containing protein n=1 Tax=Angiostrongylus costaricensis TaxID=334426 RepID=A0A158PHV6_ANGCS|nr:unnamed protein product [Angiostrongylus costaricensis]
MIVGRAEEVPDESASLICVCNEEPANIVLAVTNREGDKVNLRLRNILLLLWAQKAQWDVSDVLVGFSSTHLVTAQEEFAPDYVLMDFYELSPQFAVHKNQIRLHDCEPFSRFDVRFDPHNRFISTLVYNQEDYTIFNVIIGDFNAKVGPIRTYEERPTGTHELEWNKQGEGLSEFIMPTNTIHDQEHPCGLRHPLFVSRQEMSVENLIDNIVTSFLRRTKELERARYRGSWDYETDVHHIDDQGICTIIIVCICEIELPMKGGESTQDIFYLCELQTRWDIISGLSFGGKCHVMGELPQKNLFNPGLWYPFEKFPAEREVHSFNIRCEELYFGLNPGCCIPILFYQICRNICWSDQDEFFIINKSFCD